MSKACESVSLNEYPCVKPAGHVLDELGAGRESLAEAEERRYREYMESQPDLGE